MGDPRPAMSHEQIWEVIAALGLQEQSVYERTQETHTKIRLWHRDYPDDNKHLQERLADLEKRADRITELRGRLRKLVDARNRPESMEWDI